MPLATGQTLSFYEILGPLGVGGMGEVWRARDTRLEREVAIKVLPEELADDEERLKRFEREAKTLATLHHANIASIFGIDQVGETSFISMELVAGEDLATRLARGPLPVGEAIETCRQIAEGLEAAHEAGVVHRDLKPANVRITPEGAVKILDFGLAKPMRPKAGAGGTTAAESDSFLMTEEGLVLGTPTYMSPEQARGKPVDRRADVWAFGCVLYECLTGKRAFGGESIPDTLAGVLEREPDWSALPGATPAHVRALLERSLVKDPRLRLRDVGEARIALGAQSDESAAPSAASRSRSLWLLPLGILAGFGSALLLDRGLRDGAPSPRIARTFEIPSPGIEEDGLGSAISPDGRTVATIADGHIRLHLLETAEIRDLAGTDGVHLLTWSPASDALAYRAGAALWRVDRDGGKPSRICELASGWVGGAGLTWGAGDRIVFSVGGGSLFEVPARGGEARVLLAPGKGIAEHFHVPSFLPDGQSLVYARHGPTGLDRIEVLVDGERKTILEVPGARLDGPCWSPTGHVVYQREFDSVGVWALPFSLERMEATGEPLLIVRGSSRPTVSQDGALLHFVSRIHSGDSLGWVDETGVVEPFGEERQQLEDPALAADGRRVVVTVGERDGKDIYVHDLERGTWTRLTHDEVPKGTPRWAPGDRVVYDESTWSGGTDARRTAADGSGQPELLVEDAATPSISADGRWLVFVRQHDVFAQDLERGGAPLAVVDTPAKETRAVLSPDGRWIAYRSDTSGRMEIYVQPFPSGSGRWQVSSAGGNFPRWSPAGDRLFYVEEHERGTASDRMMAVSVETEPELALGVPEPIFERPRSFYVTDYDPAHHRFLAVVHEEEGEEVANPLRLTLDW